MGKEGGIGGLWRGRTENGDGEGVGGEIWKRREMGEKERFQVLLY